MEDTKDKTPKLQPNECNTNPPKDDCRPTWVVDYNYITVNDLITFYQFQPTEDTNDVQQACIAFACERVNYITGNKINGIGFNNLNATEKYLVKRACARLSYWYLTNGIEFFRATMSQSGNGVSVSYSPPSEPDYVLKEVYNFLELAGLYIPRKGYHSPIAHSAVGDTPYNEFLNDVFGSNVITWDVANRTFLRGYSPYGLRSSNNSLGITWLTSGTTPNNPIADLVVNTLAPPYILGEAVVVTDGNKLNVKYYRNLLGVNGDNELTLLYDQDYFDVIPLVEGIENISTPGLTIKDSNISTLATNLLINNIYSDLTTPSKKIIDSINGLKTSIDTLNTNITELTTRVTTLEANTYWELYADVNTPTSLIQIPQADFDPLTDELWIILKSVNVANGSVSNRSYSSTKMLWNVDYTLATGAPINDNWSAGQNTGGTNTAGAESTVRITRSATTWDIQTFLRIDNVTTNPVTINGYALFKRKYKVNS